jgi:acetyl-CoA carboxylase alpha subunit
MANNIREKLRTTLEELTQYSMADLIEQRYKKFRIMGQFKEME